MGITNKIKEKVFAQYLGQPFRVILNSGEFSITECNLGTIQLLNTQDVLILKPLSKISNEDMVWVFDTIHNTHEQRKLRPELLKENSMSLEETKRQINIEGNHWLRNAFVFQYLLSKGYDLPNFLLGYKTLFESELCIYE